MNILDKIIAQKRVQVNSRKMTTGIRKLEDRKWFRRDTLSLRRSLVDETKTGIIAEYKRRSPSKGIINDRSSIEDVTAAYANHGASGISVLTDEEFFGGSSTDLLQARINEVPLLRKDFMIDEYQLVEAKALGADVILLIAACLSVQEVKRFSSTAKNLGLEVLLEVHNREELGHVCPDVDLVGVNNRNLKTFEVSIQTSLDLVKLIPGEMLPVAESGISDVETIVSLKRAGFKGFLIGENFMKANDPAVAFADFVQRLKAKHED